jgi:hypothetical protein
VNKATPQQRSRADAHVAPQRLEPVPAPAFPRLLAQGHQVSESAQRCLARLFRTHTGGTVFGDLLLQMKFHLRIQTSAFLAAPQQHLEPHP